MEDFKCTVRHDRDYTAELNPLEQILTDNGIVNIGRFLTPTIQECHDPFLLRNMDEAVKLLKKVASGRIQKIIVKIDPDVDGFTSAAMMYILLRQLNPQADLAYILPEGKIHGCPDLKNEVFEGTDLLILPDAGSDPESIEQYNLNCPESMHILVLDHHPIEYYSDLPRDQVTMVNCQDGMYPNTDLTGAGVVRKLYEACVKKIKDRNLEEIYPYISELTALGQIADVSDLRSLESRYYAYEGLSYINLGVAALQNNADVLDYGWPVSLAMHGVNESGYFISGPPTIKDIGWRIAPPMNAVIRCGTELEKGDLFRALIGDRAQVGFSPRRRRKEDPKPDMIVESRQRNVWRKCINVKDRQSRQVRKALTEYRQWPTEKELQTNSAVIFIRDKDDEINETLNGLIANKLAAEFKRPVLFLGESGQGMVRGSCRGYEKSGIGDFRSIVEASGVCSCIGHPNAFGVSLKKSDVETLMSSINEAAPIETLETAYVVDYEVDAKNLTNAMVKELGLYQHIWGNHVEEPKFLIKNIRMKAGQIKEYQDGRFVQFSFNRVSYARNIYGDYARANWFREFTHADSASADTMLNIRLIGSFAVNHRDGKDLPYVLIEDWYSWTDTEVKDNSEWWEDEDIEW